MIGRPANTARAGVALGSNLGDRAANLISALDALRRLCVPAGSLLAAPLYETEPQACPDGSPPFLNTVIEIGWHLTPLELLEETRRLEAHLGRNPSATRNAPRVIDIDILYCGDNVINHPVLILPHPRLAQRRFVLVPLAAIRPQLQLPGSPATILQTLQSLDSPEPLPTAYQHPLWDEMRLETTRRMHV